jgi:nucleotide-binding universal stress UspA family protein
LICYDGSPDAKAAIERGAELLNGTSAIVLTVWQPFTQVLARSSGLGFALGGVDVAEIDKVTRENAEARAEEGAKLAHTAGLNAQPQTCSHDTSTAGAILAQADAVDANAILVGSRGLTGIKSRLLGSVSHAVIQHADRTVIVVPSPDVAAARERERVAHGRD